MSMVVSHCNQLCELDLTGLQSIIDMCALCEDPEPSLCFVTLLCMIFLQKVRHGTQKPTIGQYCGLVQFSKYLHSCFSNPPFYSML